MATVNLGRIKFVWQGAYNGATAYVADDVVSYNGSSYICILSSTGNLPTNTTYWQQMSSAGTNGTNGTDLTTTLTTQGDIVYRNATTLARLGAGTSGQVLTTQGAGANPTWSTVGATAGQVIQVVSTTKTDTFSQSTTTTFADVTGLSVSITPSSTSSKILITGYINAGGQTGNKTAFRLMRGTTSIGGGTATGNTQSSIGNADTQSEDNCETVGINYLDSPNTTSSTTYKIQMISHSSTGYVNRTFTSPQYDNAEAYAVKMSSTITVMEIKG